MENAAEEWGKTSAIAATTATRDKGSGSKSNRSSGMQGVQLQSRGGKVTKMENSRKNRNFMFYYQA